MAALNDEVRGERPVGSQFKPSDRELLYYLYNKANGIPVPDNYPVYSMNVYVERIWRILFEKSADEDTFYFYTPLKQRSEHDRRIIRVAADGVWKNQQHPKPIYDYDGTTIIGSIGNFTFIPKDGFQETRRKWVMHEYRLDDRYAHNLNSNLHGLCRIREKKSRNGSSAADDNGNGRAADYGPSDDENMSQRMMELENIIMGGPGAGAGPEPEPDDEDISQWIMELENIIAGGTEPEPVNDGTSTGLDDRYAHNLNSNLYGLCRIRKMSRNGSSAADDNGIPADYGRPDDEDMSQSFENWLSDVIVSP